MENEDDSGPSQIMENKDDFSKIKNYDDICKNTEVLKKYWKTKTTFVKKYSGSLKKWKTKTVADKSSYSPPQ